MEQLQSGSENVRKLIEAASDLQLESVADDVDTTSTESPSSSSNADVQYGAFSETGSITSVIYQKLAFTRPKAGREVGPLNWTQEHKSV